MSPAAAPARTPARTPARKPAPSRRSTPQRTPLRVVAPVPSRAPRAPFVLFSMALVGLGLAGLLVLNTVVAQDAFTLHDLAASNAALDEREQLLREEVAALEAPHALSDRATKLGMVPAGDPVFLTPDGRVLGNPVPATAPPAPPPPPAPKPSAAVAAKPGTTTAAKPAAKPNATTAAQPKPAPSATVKP